jgi:PPOX class probable F420-dependent enzyme
MVAIPESARKVIESGRLAHIVTLNKDGSPQVTIVWVGTDGDELVTAHFNLYQKLRNVQRDDRVVLSIETDESNPQGLTQYLVVHGRARITEGGAGGVLQQHAKK